MSDSVVFRGSGREFSFKRFALESIPAKPGVLCLAVFFKKRWLPLQFEHYFDLSKVDMRALINDCSQKYSDLDASDVNIFLDIHDSDNQSSRVSEVIILSKANGMGRFSKESDAYEKSMYLIIINILQKIIYYIYKIINILLKKFGIIIYKNHKSKNNTQKKSKIHLLEGKNFKNDKIANGPIYFKGKYKEFSFYKFEPGNIPAKPGIICLAVFHEGRWLPLQFEQFYDLSRVDMNALIQSLSKKYSDLDASDVIVFLDIRDVDESNRRQSDVIKLRKAYGLSPFTNAKVPLLSERKFEKDDIMEVPVIFKGANIKFWFKRYTPESIPAKPGVLCLALYYKGRWLPLKFEQFSDLSKMDINALIQSCSKKYTDLNISDVVAFLNIHNEDNNTRRQSQVMNLCEAYCLT